jgi:N,N'-diacetyllegionaminate synthase
MNNKKTIVIAEAGVNHNGDIAIARKMVDIAAVSPSAKMASYQQKVMGQNKTQYEMLSELELSNEMHYELSNYCKQKKIGFLSTGFDIDSVKFLISLGLDFLKIPSGEITNIPYLRYIGKQKNKIIISTGMASFGEIEIALNTLESMGAKRKNITVLHCTTEYPAPMQDVNLRVMEVIGNAFGVNVGYSDHTIGIEVSIAAAALGATVIEKHFTLDKSMDGPDHQASIEPSDLINMVASIRNIEKAMGDGVKRISAIEQANKIATRKSIVAKKRIKKGEILSEENISIKRPGDGISPVFIDLILGKRALKDYIENEKIILMEDGDD